MSGQPGPSKRELANQELEDMAYRLESRVHTEVVFSEHARTCYDTSKQNFEAFHACNKPSLERLKRIYDRQSTTQYFINSKMQECFSNPRADCVETIKTTAKNIEHFLLN